MSVSIRYPNEAVQTYPTFSDFPSTAGDGALAVALDTDVLYVFNAATETWLDIASPSAIINPTLQTRYVNKSGNDTSGDGSLDKPFLTIGAANTSITDASSSNLYAIFVGPGTYPEGGSSLFKNFVYIVGSSPYTTIITGNSTYTPANTATSSSNAVTSGIFNCQTANITVTRSTTGHTRLSFVRFFINGCSTGSVTYSAAGIVGSPQTPDNLTLIDTVVSGSVTVSSSNVGFIRNCQITSGITINNSTIYSSGNFLNSTITGINVGAGTITTQTGLSYPIDGTTAGTLGGGGIQTYSSAGPQGASNKGQFTYTAYDPLTGIFSGVVYSFGFPNNAVGDYLTNQGNGGGIQIFDSKHSGSLTITSTGSNNGTTATAKGVHGLGAPIVLNGSASLVQADSSTIQNSNGVTLQNGAIVANFQRTTPSEGVGYVPQRSSDWITASFATTGTTASGSATITAIPSTAGIYVGATVTGTGVPTNATVRSLTSTTVTLTVSCTASGSGVALTFQNVIPNSVQQGLDGLAASRVLRTGDTMTGTLFVVPASGPSFQATVPDGGITAFTDVGTLDMKIEPAEGVNPINVTDLSSTPIFTVDPSGNVGAASLSVSGQVGAVGLSITGSGTLGSMEISKEDGAGNILMHWQSGAPGAPDASKSKVYFSSSGELSSIDPVSAISVYATKSYVDSTNVTLAAVGSSPNANGASLTGQTLNLEPASASFGGIVTTGTQSFAGAKTFSSALTALSDVITSGSVKMDTAGGGIFIKEGSDATMGTAVLVGGTVTVSTTKVTASSRIFLTAQVVGGTQGPLSVGTVVAGTSFVINSGSGLDTSTVAWMIVEPA